MKFKTNSETLICTDYTSLKGYIQATRADLEKTFGPADVYAGDKSTTHWDIEFEDGTVATLYDWKRAQPEMDEVCNWNIGGRDHDAVINVHNAYRRAMGSSVRSRLAA